MKYWVFQSNQVVGPFDRDSLSSVAGFSSETLVCPEGRKGTQMGDWTRAAAVPDLAEALLAATRVPALARSGAERGHASLLPPEPTLRDLAVLGSLQEKVGALEGSVGKLQEELRTRDTEISRLRVELDQKGRAAADVQAKVADLEVKTFALSALKEDLDKAKEETRSATARIEAQERMIEDLKARAGGFGAPASAPPMGGPILPPPGAPAPARPPIAAPPDFPPLGGPGGAPPFESPLGGPMGGPPPLEAPPSFGGPMAPPMGGPQHGGMGRLAAIEAATPDPFAPPPSAFPPGELAPAAEPLVSLGGPPAADAGAAGATDLVTGAALGPRRDKKVFVVIAAMAVLVTGGVFMLGGRKGKKKAPAAPTLAQPAPPPPAPSGGPEASGGEPSTDLTQAAVDFVKGYQIPGRQETVAQLLETRYPTTGRLSPWMVEKLDNDKYQVNFWASQAETAPGPKPVFQFQVRVKARLLQGLNPPAVALLNDGSVPAPESGSGGVQRRGRRPRSSAGGLDAAKAVLEGLKAGSNAAQPKPARKGRKAKAALPTEEASQETQLPPEVPGDGSGGDGAAKSSEEETLDQLLLPGVDQPGTKKKRR